MLRIVTLGIVLLVGPALAGPCEAPEYRQFDFWAGDWQITRPDGSVAGTNLITREYGGCVLHEHYTTPKGYSGESLNIYDAGRKVWHQTWVDGMVRQHWESTDAAGHWATAFDGLYRRR